MVNGSGFSYLVEFMESGPVVAMELKGANAITKWRTLLGPTDSATARIQAPLSIRAKFGTGMYSVMWQRFITSYRITKITFKIRQLEKVK